MSRGGRALKVFMLVASIGVGLAAEAEPQARPRVEAGPTTGLASIFPTVGGLVSVRTGGEVAIEAGVDVLPWHIEDGDEAWLLFQAQLRLPWRTAPDKRRSVVLGLSSAAILERDWVSETPGGPLRPTNRRLTFSPLLIPHAGLSWQWRTGRYSTVRLDVQALVPLQTGIPVPRVACTWLLPGWAPAGQLTASPAARQAVE